MVGLAPKTLPTQARYSTLGPTVARLEQGRAVEDIGTSSLMLTRRDHAALALLRLYGDDRRGGLRLWTNTRVQGSWHEQIDDHEGCTS